MRRAARWLLFLAAAGVVLGLGKVHAAAVAIPPYDYTGSTRFAWSFAFIALLCVAGYGVGLPDLSRSARSAVAAATGAVAVAALGISVLQLLTGSQLLPRFVVLLAPVILVPVWTAAWALSVGGHARAGERDRVVAVLGADEAAALETDLERRPEQPAVLAGTVDVAAATRGGLSEAAERHRATLIVLGRHAQADDAVVAQAAALHESGVRVRTLSLFYDEWLGKLPLSELERVSLMFDIGEVHRARYGRLKRVVDIVVGTVGTVVLVAVTPLVVLGDLVANRGPVFFVQERVGRWNQPYRMYKFRSMRGGDAPSAWTAVDDPRVTPFGRVLRRTHLDELPQALNILKGDQSVVGPRPEQPRYVDELEEKIPFYRLRHLVRPGLTGWAQVKYPYGASEIDAMEKLQYEFYYLRHQSLTLDLRILGRTIRSVLGGQGR